MAYRSAVTQRPYPISYTVHCPYCTEKYDLIGDYQDMVSFSEKKPAEQLAWLNWRFTHQCFGAPVATTHIKTCKSCDFKFKLTSSEPTCNFCPKCGVSLG